MTKKKIVTKKTGGTLKEGVPKKVKKRKNGISNGTDKTKSTSNKPKKATTVKTITGSLPTTGSSKLPRKSNLKKSTNKGEESEKNYSTLKKTGSKKKKVKIKN